MDEHIPGKRLERIVIKVADHTEERKLAKVNESTSRRGASQEEDSTVRGAIMELHKVSQGVLVAGVNHPCLRLGQN